jgi:hypothetical protein
VQVTVARFGRDIAGTPLASFLAHHLMVYSQEELRAVIRDIRPSLPEELDGAVEGLASDLADGIEKETAGKTDTALVLERVAKGGAAAAQSRGVPVGDATLLDFFEAVMLEAALLIDQRPAVRERLLSEERGWFSRYWWTLLAGVVGLTLVLARPRWAPEIIGWLLLGVAILPPVGAWIRTHAES